MPRSGRGDIAATRTGKMMAFAGVTIMFAAYALGSICANYVATAFGGGEQCTSTPYVTQATWIAIVGAVFLFAGAIVYLVSRG